MSEARKYMIKIRLLGCHTDKQWSTAYKQVVKVIWHKAASPRQMDSSIIFARWCQWASHEGTLASPHKYDWTCASFSPPESASQTANQSFQPFFAQLTTVSPYTLQWAPLSPKTLPSHGDLDPHLTRFLGPSEPFLHRRPQRVPILHNRMPPSPSNRPFPWGDLYPHVIHGSLGQPTWVLNPKKSSQRCVNRLLIQQTTQMRTALSISNMSSITTSKKMLQYLWRSLIVPFPLQHTPILDSEVTFNQGLQEGQHPLTGQRAPPISGGS